MSLFDKKAKKKKNTLAFLGIKNIADNYIEIESGDFLIFYKIQPINISAMPAPKIKQYIDSFGMVLSLTKYELELISFPSYENYDDVIETYKTRIEQYRRENPSDRRIDLLEEDIRSLNEINATRSGAKEFFILLRLNIGKRRELDVAVAETRKLISDANLNPDIVVGENLKGIIQIYLENFRA